MYVTVPAILRLAPSMDSPGQVADIAELALTQEDAIVHMPTMSPPHAAVLPHVPPEPPQPERTTIARQGVIKIDRVIFMLARIAPLVRPDNPYSPRG